MGGQAEGSRTWRGQTIEERQAGRRERLIEAGIELFGTRGYANTPVKAICEEAGLTERYFYEAFEDRESLLDEIYSMVLADCRRATVEAIDGAPDDFEASMRAGLTAFAHEWIRDPRRARIQEIEVVGVSPEIERKRRDSIHAFAGIVVDRTLQLGGREQLGALRLDVIALGLIGSVNEQLIDFVLGDLQISLDDLIENQIAAFAAVASQLLE
ncbi:MAG TPA: TetR/AcrR family transcriptional regulator [Solirubrobacterales bacterium]|nr:TetR/AcrR family transcriptional regulator [Solirubrobacterales bacterium]HMU27077.1 TetR/AcrR family transcriptional regulator [Solirubrobacterales bacterium]HMX70882.1 TetR/AcrR family transcriptional regulator [Solirubrobacterales bacterium]HMY26081.1 TetR/AcrR family transcriptional regulator [Solirubrobacterales bacterium]HNA22903.1 TetR/AcrR family transcriptional regulator [Solirubrobacterales bacterium]